MILPIVNPEISVGDVFVGAVNGSLLEVCEIREKGCYYSPSGRKIERKEPLVHFKDIKTGRIFETNLITAQTLLMKRSL